MAVAGQAVPKHLRGVPGACLAVSVQALNWRMDPFAVANKSYMVNDRIAYEAQLIHAVIEQRAPIKGRIKGTLSGEGAKLKWTLSATTTDGDIVNFVGNEIGNITTKHSPLWKSDPSQQLWYYSVRAMCRRHFPDVLLGVYEKDEIKHAEGMRDVTPPQAQGGWAQQARAARGEVMPPEDEAQEPEPEDIDQTDASDEEPQQDEQPDHVPHWTDDVDPGEGAPGTEAWQEGVEAFKQGAPVSDCPHEDDMEAAQDWCGGYAGARRAGE